MSLRLAALFSEHMVLQREKPLPIWGWGNAGETITVTCAGVETQGITDENGAWKVTFPALQAGGPFTMAISSASEKINICDVLIGDVWICSGQSNMEWPLQAADNGDEEVAAANHPTIRLFTVPQKSVAEPLPDVEASWLPCTPQNASSFSAVGYFFGREMNKELGVPIGLINTSWGGTIAEAWTSREALLAEKELAPLVELYESEVLPNYGELAAKYQHDLTYWETEVMPKDAGNSGLRDGWASVDFDSSAWPVMELPQLWQAAGLDFNGVVWFRHVVNLSADWRAGEITLAIGACDKGDDTYVNGIRVGGIAQADRADSWCVQREYTFPAELLHPGKNVIAVRVHSTIYGAGMTGPKQSMILKNAAGDKLQLAGNWQYQVEQQFPPAVAPPAMPQGPGNPNTPYALYSGMIAPLIPFAIAGAIWYQGESNADRAKEYQTLFPTMISDWRNRWGVGDFPFYFVQLANFNSGSDTPQTSNWAELREAQSMTLSLPNTGMAVTIDIGEGNDVHPRNKQEVGRRLALNALAQNYSCDIEYSGPRFSRLEVAGNKLRVIFDHIDKGLRTTDGEAVSGFALAGADGIFYVAEATIDNNSVLVSSSAVPLPLSVRYGWAGNPACNLYNSAGLPASPFRSK